LTKIIKRFIMYYVIQIKIKMKKKGAGK